MQLVDLSQLIPSAIVDMRYTGSRNIARRAISEVHVPQMIPAAAQALQQVALDLQQQELRLVIWDAYRTEAVQKILLSIVPGTPYVLEKSKHCLGIAIDLTLATREGNLLDMGTDHDNFSPLAHANAQDLTAQQHANRKLLTDTMIKHGFFAQWPYEWWHFDFVNPPAERLL